MNVLISSCVLGNNVRWNGANKKSDFIDSWAEQNGINLIPICAENDLLGTPRRNIRMIQIGDKVAANCGDQEVFDSLENTCRDIINRHPDCCGFIGLANSPTCGISAGVKNRGATIRGAMHRVSPFPTCEVNSLRHPEHRLIFLKKLQQFSQSSIMNSSQI